MMGKTSGKLYWNGVEKGGGLNSGMSGLKDNGVVIDIVVRGLHQLLNTLLDFVCVKYKLHKGYFKLFILSTYLIMPS